MIIGALTTLEQVAESPLLADYRSLFDVVDGVRSIQIQSMGTLGGDLCHLPNCWYFRNGYGLLGIENGESLPELGDNRYHAVLGNRGQTNYAAAKAGLHGAVKSLAREMASRGITANVVAPGVVAGRMSEETFTPEQIRQIVPMARAGKPEEVAALVGFLAGDSASYISGQVIGVDGAMS